MSGGIDVNGSITPISKEEIVAVSAQDWNNLPITELFDQLATLQNRRIMLLSMHKGDFVAQIEQGIAQLEQVINARQATNGESII